LRLSVVQSIQLTLTLAARPFSCAGVSAMSRRISCNHSNGNEHQMTVSITVCPGCHYRFNYEWIPSASFHSIRLGPKRMFRCPKCRELHKFSVMHFGSDPNLPTHGDNAETGIGKKIWALLLVPSLALLLFGAFLPVFVAQSLSYFFIPIVLGIAWASAYVVYLIWAVK